MLNQDFGTETLVQQQNKMYGRDFAPHYNFSVSYTDNSNTGIDLVLPILGPKQIWVKNEANDEIIAVTLPEGVISVLSVTGTVNQIDVDNADPENPILSLSPTISTPGTFTVQGTVALDSVIDDDTFATATATNIPTSESVKAYVDSSHPVGGIVDTIVPTPNQILVDSSDPENPIVSLSTTIDTPGLFNIQSSTQVGSIIDDDTMATASATSLATSASIKAYVDAHSGGGGGNVGDFVDFGGTVAPTGCLVRDGSAVSRTTYADLFAVIGTTWGAGDGFSTFNLPNSQRSVSVGSGGTATATLGNLVGNTGGAETHTLTIAEMPAHTHSLENVISRINDAESGSLSGNPWSTQRDTGSTGGGDPHSIIQPSVVVLPCIRYQVPASSSTGGLKSIQVFTSSGTWTKPAGIVKIRVKVIGAGGGGGGVLGGPSALYAGSGGGGGGGGFSEKWLDVTGLTSEVVTVGHLGIGGDGSVPNPGATGGTSFFGAICYAGGGVGGTEREAAEEVNFTLGGAGGFGVNGDFNAPGSPGAFGMASPTGAQAISGMGGGSTISGGAPSAYAGNPQGRAGAGYGGGGSGGVSVGVANADGGNGAPGFILVWEYGE